VGLLLDASVDEGGIDAFGGEDFFAGFGGAEGVGFGGGRGGGRGGGGGGAGFEVEAGAFSGGGCVGDAQVADDAAAASAVGVVGVVFGFVGPAVHGRDVLGMLSVCLFDFVLVCVFWGV